MPNSVFPDTSGLHRILSGYEGSVAYLVPITGTTGRPLGNNGDHLMHLVFYRILNELGIAVTSNQEAADLLIVPPSGSLLEKYSFPKLLAYRLRDAKDKPVVVFPSSALFPSTDPADIFRGRTAETTLILRERYSHTHLAERWGTSLANAGVALELDHDVVASGHKYVPEILGPPASGGGLLIAARRDRERSATTMDAPAAAPTTPSPKDRLSRLVPQGPARTFALRSARRKLIEDASAELMATLPAKIRREAGDATQRRRMVDASAVQFATFREYRRLIRRADFVVTNRLHVGLPAAILGKRVILVEAGYHKLSGVYDQSISAAENVTLLERARTMG